MSDYFNVTTNVGDAAIATAIANNSKLNITHIAFGDGNGSVPTPTKTRTSLVREVHRQAITKYAMHPTIANYIVIETIIPSNIGGFWIREMGIIADNVLISHGSHAPFFKVADPDGVSEYRLKFTQNVRDGNVVEISLDESLIYASQAWVNENYIRRNELVDNLTTDDAKKPVSSKQAKNLQDNKLDKTANAVSSSKLEKVRTVSFSGAATGSFSYDGSSNSSAILTLANSGVTANTYGASLKIPIITVNAKGLITGVSEQNIPIVDNLTTDDASKPLSAAQGKILNDQKLNKDENAVGIKPIDNRILKPSEISLGVQAYFATLNSDNGDFFCDFLSLNGWSNASGGLKNALVLSKTGQSLHHYQAEYASQTWTIKKQIAYIDDNVASASKLKVPRKINNVDFDGTSDITVTDDALTYMPIPYPKSSPPTGYLAMMGQAISESTYPKLYALYGAVLPDMRAYSVRGLDYGRGIDVGRVVLSEQNDAIRNIVGSTGVAFRNDDQGLANRGSGALLISSHGGTNYAGYTGQYGIHYGVTFDASRTVPVATENRVKNIAFLYIVKAG